MSGMYQTRVRRRREHKDALPRPLALTDEQLTTVMAAATCLAPERRDIYLQRIGAMLKLRGRFNDVDVAEVVQLALYGLAQHTDSAA